MAAQTDANGFPLAEAPTSSPQSSNIDPNGFPILGSGSTTPQNTTAPVPPPPTPSEPQTDANGFPLADQPKQTTNIFGKPVKASDTDPLLNQAWDWLNRPLVDLHREGAGGLERGVESVASGFTSPLSIALTIGTFGTGGLIESAGANALRESGLMSAAEIADVAKGSEAVAEGAKAGLMPSEALAKAGFDDAAQQTYKKGIDLLYNSGLKEADLTGGNLIERGTSKLFRNLGGLDYADAQKYSRFLQTGVNAGFTAQALTQAAQNSPRVLDDIRDGDYDSAMEHAVEAGAGAGFGILGLTHTLKSAGELAEPILGKQLRPSDESFRLRQELDTQQGDIQQANERARILYEDTMGKLGFKNPETSPLMSQDTEDAQNATLAKIYHAISLGSDKAKAAQYFNAIAESAGRDDRLIDPTAVPYGAADDWTAIERKVSKLTGLPSEDVSLSTLDKAGTDQATKDAWEDYMKRPYAPAQPDNVLAEHARVLPVSSSNDLSPAVMLNDYAHEMISRTPGVGTNNWEGQYWSRDSALETIKELRDKNPNSPVAASLENTLGDNPGIFVSKQNSNLDTTFDHEQVHHWRDQNPLSAPQQNSIKQNPSYIKAITELQKRGYNNRQYFLDEVGAHLATGDNLGLPKSEAESLAKSYFGAYNEQALRGIPASGPLLPKTFKELGYAPDINQRTIESLLDQKARIARGPTQGGIDPATYTRLVAEGNLRNKPADYIDGLLNSFKGVYDGLSPKESQVSSQLRDSLSKGLEDAQNSGLMKNGVEDYMRRIWKKPNDASNRVINEAGSGRFSTSVSMARQRVWDSLLEPLLKGEELATEDPVKLTSQWNADVYKAIANRKVIERLLDNNVRGSDGLPAAALKGQAQVLEGSNGENPVTSIQRNRVRNIGIADAEVQRLKDSGELDRHLDNGTIENTVPTVRKDNIQDTINAMEKRGISNIAKYDADGNNILRRDIQTLKDVRDGKLGQDALDNFNANQPPNYVWRPQGYITIDNPAFRKWNYFGADTGGNPVVAQSEVAVHPEYADYLRTRLGLDKSALQENPITQAFLKGGSKVKKTLLSLSPFHMNQEALRAIMLGINPIMKAAPGIEDSRVIPEDPYGRTVMRIGVDNGLTQEPDFRAIDQHSTGMAEGLAGHNSLISKIPGVGKPLSRSLDAYEDFLFKKYIPNLKARAFDSLYGKYQAAHPDWTTDQVGKIAAAHTNDSFGSQNWRMMGRSATTQDLARAVLLAPDWLESELRSAARLLPGQNGGISRVQVARMAAGMWGVARVLNMVTTGQMHNEAPFGVVVKNKDGKEITYSMRTLPVDILHMASDPMGFLKGRLNPMVRAADEVYSGRDFYGRKLSPGDRAIDIFRSMAPLPLQAVGQLATGGGPEVGNAGQIVKALGGTATVYRTEAQKLAAQLASNHNEQGPVDNVGLARHQRIIQFEDQLRTGQVSPQEIHQLVLSGALPEADYKRMQANLKQTAEMPNDIASLYTRTSRLPLKEMLQVFDTAVPSEKTALLPLIKKAKTTYIRKAMKNMTPDERMRDPVIRDVQRRFPQDPLF